MRNRNLIYMAFAFALIVVMGVLPTTAADTSKIAFTSTRDGTPDAGNMEIYVMDSDGTGQTRLTFTPFGFEYNPTWSPDGSRIAFDSIHVFGASYDICAMNADGTGLTRLTTRPGSELYPEWSPDGSRIAYLSGQTGYWEVFVMNADGTGQTQLTYGSAETGATFYHTLTWSPDSSRIAFGSEREGGGSAIYVVNSDGTGLSRVTSTGNNGNPDWSPDGGRIAYVSYVDQNYEIFTMNPDGTGQTRLTFNQEGDGDLFPSWSPDSSRIAFASSRGTNPGTEIYVMSADGSDQTALTSNSSQTNTAPAWGGVINAEPTPPKAEFTFSPPSPTTQDIVWFTDGSSDDGTIVDWDWDFGDGSTSTGEASSHTYAATGEYTVTLTVTDDEGLIATATQSVTVFPLPPAAAFEADVVSGVAPLTVHFTDTSSNIPTSWAWSFGDGETSTDQNPVHTYDASSTYTVGLTVSNAGGSDVETKVGYIIITAPVFRFSPSSLSIPIGATSTTTLYLDELDTGLSGLDVTLGLSDSTVGEIVGVSLPGWGLAQKSTLPADTASIHVVDLNDLVGSGESALVGTVTVRGDRVGETELRVTQSSVDDEGGHKVNAQPATCAMEVPLSFVTVPGGKGAPHDMNSDGKYEDVNGNNRKDFADVVLYFNQMSWVAANEPMIAFDYNGNSRIDFADVVWLFNNL